MTGTTRREDPFEQLCNQVAALLRAVGVPVQCERCGALVYSVERRDTKLTQRYDPDAALHRTRCGKEIYLEVKA